MLTYQDIKQASSNLTIEAAKRTATLRKLAHALVTAYTDSLKLINPYFTDDEGRKKPYVDTYVEQYGKLTPCTIGMLSLDQDYAINFFIRTAVNDEPAYVNYVDIQVSIIIEQSDVFIYLMENSTPIITPIEPISGQFDEATTAIKQGIISLINSQIPR
ncbi:hypothetical protein AB6G46_21665 [Providencia hangzhouensis]|uniref:hypothetical protein n=1 Tax=Providencia hangzhouensis TaxID=3031799 RepID=UPI0034DD949F